MAYLNEIHNHQVHSADTYRLITGDALSLEFGEEQTSYIEYYPDMSPFSSAMSVCAWIKKLRQSDDTIWFGYCKGEVGKDEIVISDSGWYNYWFGGNAQWIHDLKVEHGEWYHHCTTWSHKSNSLRVYHNGKVIKEASGNPVPVDGNLVIGNDCKDGGNKGDPMRHPFGGELTKLNVYSKELTVSEVKAMSDGGIGSCVEKTHGEDRRISWEDILKEKRYGNVETKELAYHEWDCIGESAVVELLLVKLVSEANLILIGSS